MGIKKYIESPEVMWEHFLAYKSQVKKNPIIVKDWVGKDATDVYREKEKPLTFIGFQNYLDDQNIITDVTDYFEIKTIDITILSVSVHVLSEISKKTKYLEAWLGFITQVLHNV